MTAATTANDATRTATANRARRKYALGQVKDHVAAAAAEIAPAFGVGTVLGVGARPGPSDHPNGLALDFMIRGSRGDQLADYVLANGDRLGVTYLIWSQQINSLDGRGWRAMEDRGSTTANHYDHVHVSFSPTGGTGGPLVPIAAGGGVAPAGLDVSDLQAAIWRVTVTALVVLGGAGLVAIGLSAITRPAAKAAGDTAGDVAGMLPQAKAAKAAGGAGTATRRATR